MFLTRKRNRRTNVNLSKVDPTSLAPGNLIPISTTRVYKGDIAKFSPSAFVQALPMEAPLVNGFKICTEYFFVPDRLYNVNLALNFNNTTDDPESVEFPQFDFAYDDIDERPLIIPNAEYQGNISNIEKLVTRMVQPGSLADYFGNEVGFVPLFHSSQFDGDVLSDKTSEIYRATHQNMIPALGYLDIFYNYYANQQIDTFPTALQMQPYSFGAELNTYGAKTYELSLIENILRGIKTAEDPNQWLDDYLATNNVHPRRSVFPSEGAKRFTPLSWSWYCSRASIFQRCLPAYYLESWLKTSFIDNSEVVVDVDEENGNSSVSLRNISAQSHIQRWLDLAMAGGSRYSDYENAQFDLGHVKNSNVPVFLGSDRQYLGSKVIYQTSGSTAEDNKLGSFAGQASGGSSFKRRTFKFDESGYFMVILSLVPDVIYTRGLNPMLEELTLADKYVPALDNIAMQPLMRRQLTQQIAIGLAKDYVYEYSCPYGYDEREFEEEDGSVSIKCVLTSSIPDDPNTPEDESRPSIVEQSEGYTRLTLGYDNEAYVSGSVGYQPAWAETMHAVSRAHGRLVTTMQSWLLTRDYGVAEYPDVSKLFRDSMEYIAKNGLATTTLYRDDALALFAWPSRLERNINFTPYIDASAYNDVFADISPDAQNFVATFTTGLIVNREKSKVNTPNTL